LLLYYITDRTQFPGTESERRKRLLDKISEAARCGIEFIQLREKDLSGRDLELIAREAIQRVRLSATKTRLLINSRTDIALASGADGVHLRSEDISPGDVRQIWGAADVHVNPVIAVSCHTESDVIAAKEASADFVVFGPAFGKRVEPKRKATGLELLHSACRQNIPVVALGGVTLTNAGSTIDAGAAGIAGIRLFQENKIETVVKDLRH
jgi:thiamine-phosphate pyrophosphorylase